MALFCYQAKKAVCAFAAALGGLDTLVFSAGIGEQSASIRARICEGLGLLGIKPHDGRDAEHAAVSSVGRDRGPAPIRLGFKNEVHEFSGRTRAFRLE